MLIFAAIRRFRRIRRISWVLGAAAPSYDIRAFLRASTLRGRALNQLLDLCDQDPTLSTVPRHGATRADLQEVYELLINAGAGQWIAGHYVPVAAFGDPFTLHFLLQSRGRLPWTQIGCLLIERFERDERGPMVMETRGPVSRDDPSYALWKLLQEQNRQTA